MENIALRGSDAGEEEEQFVGTGVEEPWTTTIGDSHEDVPTEPYNTDYVREEFVTASDSLSASGFVPMANNADTMGRRAAGEETGTMGRRAAGEETDRIDLPEQTDGLNDDGEIDLEMKGDTIPPFANDENKKLDKLTKQKQSELSQLTRSTADIAGRCKVLSEHLVNVKQEVQHTQMLAEAKKRQIESDQHMTQLQKRQCGRVMSDIQKLTADIESNKERSNAVQNEIYSGNEKLDQFKLEMNWNQEELEQWALAAKQKEEDNLMVEKYRASDESKIRQAMLAVEKLTVAVNNTKQLLDKEVTETQAVQIELDRTADHFKDLHEQRQVLIKQWEEGVKAMQRRDEAISEAGQRYATVQSEIGQTKEQLETSIRVLNEKQTANSELEGQISAAERRLAKCRTESLQDKQTLASFRDSVEVLRNQVSASALRSSGCSNKLATLSEALEEKQSKYNNLYHRFAQTTLKHKSEIENATEKDQVAEAAESYLSKTQARQKETETKIKRIKEEMFKQTQELYSLRGDEATTLGEISGGQAAIKTLQAQLQKLDQERQHQQELLYAVDFQSQLMQRKVARVSGERTLEEKAELNRKLEQLERQYEEQKGLRTILNSQIKRLEAELRAAQRSLGTAGKGESQMNGSLEELQLQIDSIQRASTTAIKEKEESLVSQNCLKLEISRLREQFAKTSDELFTIENNRQQLYLSIQENEKDIDVQCDLLKAQLVRHGA
eukprot:GHVQ01010585.1.p1 GENE.GHVQ01010585.1~~GHVQ01010585.1.p1  ORF type:complete len:726 (+),score=128.82 GHVQ01010585.1:318-2495(+)